MTSAESDNIMSMLRDSETVTIKVGPDRIRYTVHQRLLCHYSPFFAKTFEGHFKETVEGSVDLPDADVKTFEGVLSWLYTQTTEQAAILDDHKDQKALVDLYAFADKYDIPAIRGRACQALVKCYDSGIAVQHGLLEYAVGMLPDNSDVCHAIADGIAKSNIHQYVEGVSDLEGIPSPLLARILKGYLLICKTKRRRDPEQRTARVLYEGSSEDLDL